MPAELRERLDRKRRFLRAKAWFDDTPIGALIKRVQR
jgi:hypothetical protein